MMPPHVRKAEVSSHCLDSGCLRSVPKVASALAVAGLVGPTSTHLRIAICAFLDQNETGPSAAPITTTIALADGMGLSHAGPGHGLLQSTATSRAAHI